MKTLQIILLICWISALTRIDLRAQPYWGPDTNIAPPELAGYAEVLDHVYRNLEPYLTTDILTDRAGAISKKFLFTGQNTSHKADKFELYSIYTEMVESQIPYNDPMRFVVIDSFADKLYRKDGIVNIAIVHYDYNQISQLAKDANAIYWDQYELKVANTEFDPLFEENTTFIAAPLIKEVIQGESVMFEISEDFIFSNVGSEIEYIMLEQYGVETPTYIELNTPFSIPIALPGEYEFTITVHYESELEVVGKFGFSRGSSDNILSVDCGSGASVITMEKSVELPMMMHNLIVPAVISNKGSDLEHFVLGVAGVWFGCGNTTCEIKKPFIIAPGYSPDLPGPSRTIDGLTTKLNLYCAWNGMFEFDNKGEPEAFKNNGTNLLYKLRNEGFDVIILKPINGVDFVQNYAALIKELIDWVNTEKAAAGSKHENILAGGSMGAIASRYALASWEAEFMQPNSSPYKHHQVRTWISMEGEMQGGIVLLGHQYSTWFLNKKLPPALLSGLHWPIGLALGISVSELILDKHVLYQALNNPGAKSMLTYHYSNNFNENTSNLNKHPYHIQLYSELDQLGYPSCRRVGIAQGTSTATPPSGFDDMCLYDFNLPVMQVKFIPFFPYVLLTLSPGDRVRMKAHSEDLNVSNEIFRGKWYWNYIPVNDIVYAKLFHTNECRAPGSYERFHRTFHDMMHPIGQQIFCDDGHNYEATFVPTTSAFDIKDNVPADFSYAVAQKLFYDVPDFHEVTQSFGYPHNNSDFINPKAITPFDALYANPISGFHMQNPRVEIANFILNEVAPDNLFLQNRTISGVTTEVYLARFEARNVIEAGNAITYTSAEGDFKIESHSNVEFRASESITLKSGFHVKSGAIFKAIIDDNVLPDRCFTLINSNNKWDGELKEQVDSDISETFEDVKKECTLFPNPTNGMVTLTSGSENEIISVTVMNQSAQIVLSKCIIKSNVYNFDCSSLSSGLYIILVEFSESNKYLKLVKQ